MSEPTIGELARAAADEQDEVQVRLAKLEVLVASHGSLLPGLAGRVSAVERLARNGGESFVMQRVAVDARSQAERDAARLVEQGERIESLTLERDRLLGALVDVVDNAYDHKCPHGAGGHQAVGAIAMSHARGIVAELRK